VYKIGYPSAEGVRLSSIFKQFSSNKNEIYKTLIDIIHQGFCNPCEYKNENIRDFNIAFSSAIIISIKFSPSYS